MEINIRFLVSEQVFLEIAFVSISIIDYQVVVEPPLPNHFYRMEEAEVKRFPGREYRFLHIHPHSWNELKKLNCLVKVIAEDEEGRTFYSNVLDAKDPGTDTQENGF
jgi:hypothetical protein